ncbi:MAG: hypothetical protein ACYC6Y_06550 [Thermoguttaceae bacterium]
MGKKKPPRPNEGQADPSQGHWTISSQSAIVTIWESRDEQGKPVYAVTFNANRQPVAPAADEKGAPSVMMAFAKVERADKLKSRDEGFPD